MMAITVKGAQLNNGVVRVTFADGLKMSFVEHHVPMRTNNSPCHEAVWLEGKDETCVAFHSRWQYPVNRRPLGFDHPAEGWTIERFVAYWEAARAYLEAKQSKSSHKGAWQLVRLGDRDLREIKEGQWEMPAPKPRRQPRPQGPLWRKDSKRFHP